MRRLTPTLAAAIVAALVPALAAGAPAALAPGSPDPAFGTKGFLLAERVFPADGDGSYFADLSLLANGTMQVRTRQRCGMGCSEGMLTRFTPAGRFRSQTRYPFYNDETGADPDPPQGVKEVTLPDGGLIASYDDAGAPGAPPAQPHLLRVIAPDGAITRQVGLPLTFAPASIDSDGRVVGFAGQVIDGIARDGGQRTLMRLGGDLSPDPAFGDGGLVTLPPELLRVGLASATASAVRVAGWDADSLVLARLGADGAVSRVTRVRVSSVSPNSASTGLEQLIVRRGRSLVVGHSAGVHGRTAIVAFDPDGRLDRSFARRGILRVAESARVALQRDGRIVTVGGIDQARPVAGARLVLRRFTAGGRPDPTFTTRSIRTRAQSFEGIDLAVDRRGRIVVAATLIRGEGSGRLLFARFLSRAS